MDFRETNVVVGGVPGAGKSVFINGLLAQCAEHPHIDLAYVDLKHGVEAAPWAARCSEIIETRADALKFLTRTFAEMGERYDRMKAANTANAWHGFLGEREHVKLLVIDECAMLYADGVNAEERRETEALIKATRELAQQGRAAGYVIVLATQKPTIDTLPSAIRDLCTVRVAFRCMSMPAALAILSDQWSPADASMPDPCKITGQQRGRAVVMNEERATFVLVQDALITRETVDAVVKATARYRAPWFVGPTDPPTPTRDALPWGPLPPTPPVNPSTGEPEPYDFGSGATAATPPEDTKPDPFRAW